MNARKLIAMAAFAFATYSFVRAFQKLRREFADS
jgi:hypothetical protein